MLWGTRLESAIIKYGKVMLGLKGRHFKDRALMELVPVRCRDEGKKLDGI